MPRSEPDSPDALFSLPAPVQGRAALPETAHGWPPLPLAAVIIDSAVPHLDRRFDYLVPPDLDAAAQPGVRVKVRFGNQMMTGWLLERHERITTGTKFVPLKTVVSTLPVLAPEVLRLAERTAQRYAGNVADVLRNVVPPRVARVEIEFAGSEDEPAPGTPEPAHPIAARGLSELDRLLDFTQPLESPGSRCALTLPSAHDGWDAMSFLADLAQQTAAAERSAIIVVPDVRALERLSGTLEARLGRQGFARLSASDGPTPRYRDFLNVKTGRRRIVIGTRAAVWAPAHDLGLLVVWDDADTLHSEPRAPYHHAREVALMRAEQQGCRALVVDTSRSVETQRQVESGDLQEIEVPRSLRHALAPRVIATADSFNAARDPLASRARLPHLAWSTARAALQGKDAEPGPVLVQVGRAGFIPGLLCETCRTPARCRTCAGPLTYPNQLAAQRSEASCRWCGRHDRHFRCTECGSPRLRAGARGVDRTAEELGRAFPQVPVLSSSADHMLTTIDAEPALVVATTGAEPLAPGGYAAALLLDGDAQLQREGLRVPETVLGHWMRAATLVRPAAAGGTVVVTASRDDVVGALVRMNPVSFASRELAERQHLQLPPAMRSAEILGPRTAVQRFIDTVQLPYNAAHSPWIGPTPMVEDASRSTDDYRALLFFPYTVADEVTAVLRAGRAASSARRTDGSLRLRIDPLDIL
ncbi:MAG: primosomal protein N' [Micrococcaceae bacterium]